MVFGTSRRGDNGYTGLKAPVYWNVGNGLKWPVAGSG
jgi:hypothetical protein